MICNIRHRFLPKPSLGAHTIHELSFHLRTPLVLSPLLIKGENEGSISFKILVNGYDLF